MVHLICSFLFRLWGWKVKVDFPDDLKKYVVIVIPHTTNWDFPKGILVRNVIKKDIKYIAKDSLFKGPLGVFLKWLGGYPVDRSKRNNFVDAVVDIFNSKTEFTVCLAPEGKRRKVDKLKTGFYYIAKGANVPIVMTKFDYDEKLITFSKPFYPTDDMVADFEFIDNYFDGVKGKYPELSYGWPPANNKETAK